MNIWFRNLISATILFAASVGFTQTICTKVLNPNLPLRDLSIQLDIEKSRELMIYAMAGATQAAVEGIRKRHHRSPSQKFYTPSEQYFLLARAHMNVPSSLRAANYGKIETSADNPNRRTDFGSADRIRNLARDLRDSIEHQQTVSEDVADLFFYRLFASQLSTHERIRLTFLRGGEVQVRDVILMGPMATESSATLSPKFEFLPLQSGGSAKGILVLEPSMVLNVQLLN